VSIAIAIVLAACTAAAQTGTEPQMRSGPKGSELSIVAANVQMLLIAPGGKKTGFEPKARKIVKEITDSAYYEDALLVYDSGRADPNTTQTIDVKQPAPGTYRLIVSPGTAADGEEYEIHVHLYLHGGGEARTARIAGTVKAGRTAAYELSVSAEPAGVVVAKLQGGSRR
jgi:hypothetical protein